MSDIDEGEAVIDDVTFRDDAVTLTVGIGRENVNQSRKSRIFARWFVCWEVIIPEVWYVGIWIFQQAYEG